jgi:hypothetical protein
MSEVQGGQVVSSKVKINLEVTVDLGAEVPEGLEETLNDTFAEWSDGRKLFSVETVEDGLRRAIDRSVYCALMRKFLAIHGNKMVKVGPRSHASKAGVATDKANRDYHIRIRENILCTNVSVIIEKDPT